MWQFGMESVTYINKIVIYITFLVMFFYPFVKNLRILKRMIMKPAIPIALNRTHSGIPNEEDKRCRRVSAPSIIITYSSKMGHPQIQAQSSL